MYENFTMVKLTTVKMTVVNFTTVQLHRGFTTLVLYLEGSIFRSIFLKTNDKIIISFTTVVTIVRVKKDTFLEAPYDFTR